MSFNLFQFLNPLEAKEFGKINIKFHNAFCRYYERINDLLIKKYNIKIEKGQNYNPNGIYEQKDDKGHFIKLSLLHLEHYLLFSYHNWTWSDTPQYWELITPKNSLLNKDVYHLKNVCWVDVNANMSNIYSGKYKLYLNHCVCELAENKLKMTVFLDGVSLQEFIYPSREQVNNCREAHKDVEEDKKEKEDKKEEKDKEEKKDKKEEDKKEENNIKNDVITNEKRFVSPMDFGMRRRRIIGRLRANIMMNTYNKDKRLKKEFIMDINIPYDEKMDENNGHEIKVRFDHTEGSWKKGWLIDGVILELIN